MHKKLLIAAATLVASGSVWAQTLLVGYDLTGASAVPTFTATTQDGGVVSNASDTSLNILTRGAGAAASTGNNSFRTVGFQNNGISIANTDYFQFSLRATAGNTLSLSSVTGLFTGTASFAVAPGVSMQYAYSLDGTNFTLIGTPFLQATTAATAQVVDLTGVSALQNVSDSTTVTFRFYASGQTTTGGWGFNSPTAGTNGLAISGFSTPIPEPSTIALGVAGLAGMIALRRRK